MCCSSRYGHSTDVRDVQATTILTMASHSLSAFRQNSLQEYSKKEDVANTRRQETTTIHATISAMVTGDCSYASRKRT